MKKTLTMLLSAILVAGMATAVSAFEENVDYVSYGDITSANYPGSTAEGWPACPTGSLLKGTIIAGKVGDKVALDGHTADLAFDGDPATYYSSFEHSARSYVGIKLDQAYELTEVRVRIADGVATDNLHGMTIEGSNDGEHWATIIEFRQDAHGKVYHIFTPQTVKDQAYIDAGYDQRADESIFWQANGGSYQYYRVHNFGACELSIGDIEFYGNPKEATVLDDEAAANLIPTLTWFPNNILIREGATVESVDGSLTGTVIGAGGSWNKAYFEYAFDGNNRKAYDPAFRGFSNWVGLMLDEPHALTSVKVQPKRGASADLEGCWIQGSLDGRTWVNLVQFTAEDVPAKQDFVEKTITDPNGYTYFRYITDITSHGDVAEICFYGAPAAAATNIPAAEKYPVATYEKFLGTLVDTGVRSTSVDGSIVGTVIGFGDIWFNNKEAKQDPPHNRSYESAFDGVLTDESSASFEKNGALNFTGLKLDAPTVITEARLYPTSRIATASGTHFQGSVDGINWVDLAVITDADIPAEVTWITKTVTDTTAYNYVRVCGGIVSDTVIISEAAFFGNASAAAPETAAPETAAPETAAPETAAPETAAPETAAPETAAPETAAPETAAPETAAPETAAPETAAPETAAPETDATEGDDAPQTFDFGVIAAVAAVLAAAGFVVAKKRK